MIFVAETSTRSLYAFASETEAIGYCEGIDVEAGEWIFWDDAGQPLDARFVVPNWRCFFLVANGVYELAPASAEKRPSLVQALEGLKHIESGPFETLANVRAYLTSKARK